MNRLSRKNLDQIRRQLVYALRHKPENLCLELDNSGKVPMAVAARGLTNILPFDVLGEDIVDAVNGQRDGKQRLSVDEEAMTVWANYGHSIPGTDITVIADLKKPECSLYHGTSPTAYGHIKRDGLNPQKRLHVHLTDSVEEAYKVGLRHCDRHEKPVILEVDVYSMIQAGYNFYNSKKYSAVWLIDEVPAQYLRIAKH